MIVLEILSHEYCWFHCYSHKHSPNHRMFFFIFCNVGNFSVFSALDHSPDSRMILILQTISILFHRFPWWNFDVLPLPEKWYYQVALIYHEVFLRSLRIARFRREEFPRDQVELFLPFSKKFYQVVMIDRTSQSQFSTLEKTKHGPHPNFNNSLKRSSLFLYQVALVYLLQQRTSKDLVFRDISSPGSLKLKTTRTMASSQ